jgi:hypothetical protein
MAFGEGLVGLCATGLSDVIVPHLGHLISKGPVMASGAALNSNLRH